MQIKCVRPFGNFKPGDSVEVPDGAAFDTYHFEQAPEEPAPAPAADGGSK